MADVQHRVRQETLHVRVTSEALALAVRPRLEELNRRAFLSVLERVFDEFDAPDRHLRIERLDLDLGTFSVADVDRLAPIRLEQALREQLQQHLHARRRDTPAPLRQPAVAARLESLEHYLLTGTLPFWTAEDTFSFEDAVGVLLDVDPGAVVRLIRRHAANDRVLRRLALRLPDASLRRLLQALTPDDAAAILVYITDIRDYHAAEPLIAASDDHVSRVLWLVALTYVARDPGTQFNRRSFVQSLFHGIAVSERLTYEDVLSLFDAGLVRMSGHRSIASTLLTVVTELVAEEHRVNPWFVGAPARLADAQPSTAFAAPSPAWLTRFRYLDALRYFALHGVLPWSLLLDDLALSEQAALEMLPDLPLSAWQALTRELSRPDQERAWQRLLGGMSDDARARLSVALAVQTGDARTSRLADAERGDAAPSDRLVFYARLVPAILDGRDLHDEAEFLLTHLDTLPLLAAPHELHWLKSVLTHRAIIGRHSVPDAPPSSVLLAALITASADEARHWLESLHDAGLRAQDVVDDLPGGDTLEAARTLLPPDAAAAVRVLLDALSLAGPDGPGSADSITTVILEETLDQRPSQSATDLIARILRRLYGTRSPRQMLDLMATAADQLVYAGRMTAASRDDLARMFELVEAPPEATGLTLPHTKLHDGTTSETADLVIEWLLRAGDGRGSGAATTLGDDTLRHMLRRALAESPGRLRAFLEAHVTDLRARRRWVDRLSEADLARVAALLDPDAHRLVIDSAERLFSAWVQESAVRGADAARRTWLWLFLLEFLANTTTPERSRERLTHAFFAYFGRRRPVAVQPDARRAVAGQQDESAREPRVERVIDTAARLAEAAGDAPLRAVLARDRAGLSRAWSGAPMSVPAAGDTRGWAGPAPAGTTPSGTTPSGTPTPGTAPPVPRVPARNASAPSETPPRSQPRGRMAFSLDGEDAATDGQPIYISNAGLVLAAPFLPRLFQALDLLETETNGAVRIRPALIPRAVHLLQAAVDGRTAAPEPLLCLNKLLCGVSIATPVDSQIEATAHEREMVAALLRSIIATWTIVSNTSIEGLQETFLRRDGRLERTSNGWRLQVQRKTVDVLLDHLPWSLSTIIHSLMPEPIFVKW